MLPQGNPTPSDISWAVGSGAFIDRPVNAYTNLPTNAAAGAEPAVFELFLCPADDLIQRQQCMALPNDGLGPSAATYGPFFERLGSSYDYSANITMYSNEFAVTAGDPNRTPPGTTGSVDLDTYCGTGLWGWKYDDVDWPARQVVMADHPQMINSMAWGGTAGTWGSRDEMWILFHGSVNNLQHNMGMVDGHVQLCIVPNITISAGNIHYDAELFDNDQYRITMGPFQYSQN